MSASTSFRSSQAGSHVAECAGAGADLAHDHHGRMLLAPAFPDIGAAGLLAYGDEVVLADNRLGLPVDGRAGRADADPLRLAQHLAVGAVRLLRVPRTVLDQGDHAVSPCAQKKACGRYDARSYLPQE